MPIRAIARLIQTMLYARRFFPYYVYNILGGIEEDGELVSLIASLIYHTVTLAFGCKNASLLPNLWVASQH
jgi:20S proteasome alpha/beta subunit